MNAGESDTKRRAAGRISLPRGLSPTKDCSTGDTSGCVEDPSSESALNRQTPRFLNAVQARFREAPAAIVSACREGIERAAAPFAPVRVDTVSAGTVQASSGGDRVAPFAVRIVYDDGGAYEVKEATVQCRLDAGGVVTSLA